MGDAAGRLWRKVWCEINYKYIYIYMQTYLHTPTHTHTHTGSGEECGGRSVLVSGWLGGV